jgi:hypothetical protein
MLRSIHWDCRSRLNLDSDGMNWIEIGFNVTNSLISAVKISSCQDLPTILDGQCCSSGEQFRQIIPGSPEGPLFLQKEDIFMGLPRITQN